MIIASLAGLDLSYIVTRYQVDREFGHPDQKVRRDGQMPSTLLQLRKSSGGLFLSNKLTAGWAESN